MDQEWGPWIEHDGSGVPDLPIGRLTVDVCWSSGTGLIEPFYDFCTSDWPGFFWRWKRVRAGWFRTELRRVCDNPAYAPIERYRFRAPRSTALSRLAEIVERPPGAWIKDGTDADPRLPKKVLA